MAPLFSSIFNYQWILWISIQSSSYLHAASLQVTADQCKAKDLSLFGYSGCEDGEIGAGPHCYCEHYDCRLAYMRRYLPSKKDFERYISSDNNQKNCDQAMSNSAQDFFISNAVPIDMPGYPVDVNCAAMEDWTNSSIETKIPNLCSRSLGKFLRYNTVHNYYGVLQFAGKKIAPKYALLNIIYPRRWRAIRGLASCQNESSPKNGWNCLFAPVTEISDTNKRLYGNSNNKIVSENLVRKAVGGIVSSRSDPNNILQVFLYGLILSVISRPSGLVRQFMASHLISTQTGPISSISALVDRGMKGASVSMHVRHGDSCDYYILEESEYYKYKNLHGPKYDRPCYSIDMYIAQLREVHALYGVTRVYLATDSGEMIERANRETDFEWIYYNFSRSVFDYDIGWIDFYPDSFIEDVALSAVADIDLMKYGDVFIGAFTSHFSKLAFYNMVGSQFRIPPFVSLDYTLACDTVDNCRADEISRRKMTIESMLTWTPECFREVDGGYVHDKLDNCGLYKLGLSGR